MDITAGNFFGENKISFAMIKNDPTDVQIIKIVSYETSASLINLHIIGVLADALKQPATSACNAVVSDGIVRHIVTLDI